MKVYGRYGNLRDNSPAGVNFFDAVNVGSGTFFPRNSAVGLLWHMAPPYMPGETATATSIAASGLRAVPFVTPSFVKPKLAGVGIRVENATPGEPGASGIIALWDGVAGPNNKYPGKKLWQSHSANFAVSGIYTFYPNINLDRGQTYWLSLVTSRAVTIAAIPLAAGFGFSLGSLNTLPTTQATSCLGVAYSFHAGLTGLPNYFPTGATHQTTAATSPIIWYALTEA